MAGPGLTRCVDDRSGGRWPTVTQLSGICPAMPSRVEMPSQRPDVPTCMIRASATEYVQTRAWEVIGLSISNTCPCLECLRKIKLRKPMNAVYSGMETATLRSSVRTQLPCYVERGGECSRFIYVWDELGGHHLGTDRKAFLPATT